MQLYVENVAYNCNYRVIKAHLVNHLHYHVHMDYTVVQQLSNISIDLCVIVGCYGLDSYSIVVSLCKLYFERVYLRINHLLIAIPTVSIRDRLLSNSDYDIRFVELTEIVVKINLHVRQLITIIVITVLYVTYLVVLFIVKLIVAFTCVLLDYYIYVVVA